MKTLTNNKLFNKILSEEVEKAFVIYESLEGTLWKNMGPRSRELALRSLDEKYGDDLAEKYSNSNWNNIAPEIQKMLNNILNKFSFKTSDLRNIYLRANIVRLYKLNSDKFENIQINNAAAENMFNYIETGHPSLWALNEAVATLIDLHIINSFDDPELLRKPKEPKQKPMHPDWNGSNVKGSVFDKKPDWRGKTSEWD